MATISTMASSDVPVSVLGARWANSERSEWKAGFLGFGGRFVEVEDVRFLDWTVDGIPLRNRLAFRDGSPCFDITFLTQGSEGEPFAVASLRALLRTSGSALDQRVQFSDHRVGLLFCPQCGGLDCGAVTTEVRVGGDVVEWRDVAYQEGMSGDVRADEVPAFSVTFDRAQYESFVRSLLRQWDRRMPGDSTDRAHAPKKRR